VVEIHTIVHNGAPVGKFSQWDDVPQLLFPQGLNPRQPHAIQLRPAAAAAAALGWQCLWLCKGEIVDASYGKYALLLLLLGVAGSTCSCCGGSS
jgi:hypothetical protein